MGEKSTNVSLNKSIIQALDDVKDPELPSINIVELGMYETFSVQDGHVNVELLPTFSGCPALDIIEKDVVDTLSAVDGVTGVTVKFTFNPPWNTDRISAEGREKLKEYGVSPPPAEHKPGEPWEVDCPYCGSTYVTMENIFGPTACRSILYCRQCKNPFEAMKPVANLSEDERKDSIG